MLLTNALGLFFSGGFVGGPVSPAMGCIQCTRDASYPAHDHPIRPAIRLRDTSSFGHFPIKKLPHTFVGDYQNLEACLRGFSYCLLVLFERRFSMSGMISSTSVPGGYRFTGCPAVLNRIFSKFHLMSLLLSPWYIKMDSSEKSAMGESHMSKTQS